MKRPTHITSQRTREGSPRPSDYLFPRLSISTASKKASAAVSLVDDNLRPPTNRRIVVPSQRCAPAAGWRLPAFSCGGWQPRDASGCTFAVAGLRPTAHKTHPSEGKTSRKLSVEILGLGNLQPTRQKQREKRARQPRERND